MTDEICNGNEGKRQEGEDMYVLQTTVIRTVTCLFAHITVKGSQKTRSAYEDASSSSQGSQYFSNSTSKFNNRYYKNNKLVLTKYLVCTVYNITYTIYVLRTYVQTS